MEKKNTHTHTHAHETMKISSFFFKKKTKIVRPLKSTQRAKSIQVITDSVIKVEKSNASREQPRTAVLFIPNDFRTQSA